MEGEPRLLDLRRHVPWLAGGGWRGVLRRGLEHLLGLRRVWELEAALEERVARGEAPYEAFLDLAGFRVEDGGIVERLPRKGAVVVIANHPYGGADALVLSALCVRSRPDTRILANAEMSAMAPIRQWLLPLEIMGGVDSERKNLRSLREALLHLREGGVLVVFPAGAVSYWQGDSARVEDPPWPLHTARLVGMAGVPVLPVAFHGRNGDLFQIVARMHPLLRSAFIPRAFIAMGGKRVRCSVGPMIAAGDWPAEAAARNAYLRRAVEVLLGRG